MLQRRSRKGNGCKMCHLYVQLAGTTVGKISPPFFPVSGYLPLQWNGGRGRELTVVEWHHCTALWLLLPFSVGSKKSEITKIETSAKKGRKIELFCRAAPGDADLFPTTEWYQSFWDLRREIRLILFKKMKAIFERADGGALITRLLLS